MYNKNHDYYLVGGLDQKSTPRNAANKSRKLSGDFMIISSDQKVTSMQPFTNDTLKFIKKTFMIVLFAASIPFSAVIATGYIHMMINGEMK